MKTLGVILAFTVLMVVLATIIEGKDCDQKICNKICTRNGHQKGFCKYNRCFCAGPKRKHPAKTTQHPEPAGPTQPTHPCGLTLPSHPTGPTHPSIPCEPTLPSQPTEPEHPAHPNGPKHPSHPSGPEHPSHPTGPTAHHSGGSVHVHASVAPMN